MSSNEPVKGYTEEQTESANSLPILGAEYVAARDFVEKAMGSFDPDEFAKPLMEGPVKDLLDGVHKHFNDLFVDYFLQDVETNAQNRMRLMVEQTVLALLSGDEWALKKYVLSSYNRGKEVRKALMEKHGDAVRDQYVKDLEKELEEHRIRSRNYSQY